VARIVTFGEIMARMAPSGVLRLCQVLPGSLDVTFAGAEANVAASLAMLGAEVDFVTALPDGPLTEGCLACLRKWGVGTSHIRISDHGRFGIYFVEMGANQRPSRVYYDREHSAISEANTSDFDWPKILQGAAWLHLTGITPALSESAAETTLTAARTAQQMGVKVSCDINFRSKLWRWDPTRSPQRLAGDVLIQLMPFVKLLMANEEDGRLLGISTPLPSHEPSPVYSPHIERAISLAQEMHRRFPNIELFSTTFREQLSASHNNWGAMLYDTRTASAVLAPCRDGEYHPYEIRNIVDRVGSGDAFDAGLLFGLTHPEFNVRSTLEFATAAACLAHSIVGDTNYVSREEIEELMRGEGTGRVIR
jgi:2-dehydro-3-deoxygluconokinase